MATITVEELIADVRGALERVRSGEQIVVTENGAEVAEIKSREVDPEDAEIDRLVREGKLIPPKIRMTKEERRRFREEFAKLPLPQSKTSVLDALIEDREDRF